MLVHCMVACACVRVYVCLSARLTRVYGRHFKIMPFNIPEISGVWTCGVMTMVSIEILMNRLKVDDGESTLPLTVRQKIFRASFGYRALRLGIWRLVFTLVWETECALYFAIYSPIQYTQNNIRRMYICVIFLSVGNMYGIAAVGNCLDLIQIRSGTS